MKENDLSILMPCLIQNFYDNSKYFSGGYTTVKNEVKSLESDEEQEQKFQPCGSNLKQVH